MGVSMRNLLRATGIALSLLMASTALGARYIVTMKSGSAYTQALSHVKQLKLMNHDNRAVGFLGTNAVVSKTLDNIEMFVIHADNPADIEKIKFQLIIFP